MNMKLKFGKILFNIFIFLSVLACEQSSEVVPLFANNPSEPITPTEPPETPFTPGSAFQNGIVYKLISLNEYIYSAGTFTSYQGTIANRIIRIKHDGSKDSSFDTGTGFNNAVQDFCVAQDGSNDIIAVGDFTEYNRTPAKYIARIKPDGSLNKTFILQEDFSAKISRVICLENSKILVLGSFTNFVNSYNNLALLSSLGEVDYSFSSGTGFSSGAQFYTFVKDSSGNLYIGGKFFSFNGTSLSNYLKLSSTGELDLSFTKTRGFNNFVLSILPTSSHVYIGGLFTSFDGQNHSELVKLQSSGEIDSSFSIGSGFNSGGVFALDYLPQTKDLVVAGNFTRYQETLTNRFILLNAENGNVSNNYTPNLNGANSTIWTMSKSHLSNHRFYIGGSFTSYNTSVANKIFSTLPSGKNE